MKTCKNCGEIKDRRMFRKHQQSPDGLAWQCKICVGIKNSAYREANWEAIRERRKRAYNERKRDWQRAYREKNREAIAEYVRTYCQANKERVKQKVRAQDAATCSTATHSRLAWTPSEDAIAIRDGIRTTEKAFMLRRSQNAVTARLSFLRRQARLSA